MTYRVTGPWPNDDQPWHVSDERSSTEGDLYFTDDREHAEQVCREMNTPPAPRPPVIAGSAWDDPSDRGGS
jgi:hypothetical protein